MQFYKKIKELLPVKFEFSIHQRNNSSGELLIKIKNKKRIRKNFYVDFTNNNRFKRPILNMDNVEHV